MRKPHQINEKNINKYRVKILTTYIVFYELKL